MMARMTCSSEHANAEVVLKLNDLVSSSKGTHDAGIIGIFCKPQCFNSSAGA